MRALILLVGLWGLVAPCPSSAQTELSDYLTVDKPTTYPVNVMLSLDGVLVIGSDDGCYISRDAGLSWTRILPFQVKQLVRTQGFLYALVNRFHINAERVRFEVHRSDDNGFHWKQLELPYHGSTPSLFAVDMNDSLIYFATPDSDRPSLSYTVIGSDLPMRLVNDPLLVEISDIQIGQDRSLYVAANGRLFNSSDYGQTFKNVLADLPLRTGGSVQLVMDSGFMAVKIGGYHIYTSVDHGQHWQPIPHLKRYNQSHNVLYLHGLDHGTFAFTRRSKGIYETILLDLATGHTRTLSLPAVYRYGRALRQGDHWLFATTSQDKRYGFFNALDMMNTRGTERMQASPLFRVPVATSLCHQLAHSITPTILSTHTPHENGVLLDSGEVIFNKRKQLQRLHPNAFIMPMEGFNRHLVRGSKGHWYIQRHTGRFGQAAKGKRTKVFQLFKSVDRGRQWKLLVPQHHWNDAQMVIDDSLRVAYSYRTGALNLTRVDLKTGATSYSQTTDFDGTGIQQVIVDQVSRVWVQTDSSLFISYTGGWWHCPLPAHGLDDFALMDDHMVMAYRQRLYISRTDTVAWKSLTIPSVCDGSNQGVRIVGHSTSRLVLQEQQYGDLMVLDVKTRNTHYLAFPRHYGLIHRAHLDDHQLVIETTGLPLQHSTKGTEAYHQKVSVTPHLLHYSFKH